MISGFECEMKQENSGHIDRMGENRWSFTSTPSTHLHGLMLRYSDNFSFK
jgi:hypothetical protein